MPVVSINVRKYNREMESFACPCGKPDCKIIYGLCHCGCGKPTPLYMWSDKRTGAKKGQPRIYILGHQALGNKHGLMPRRAPEFEDYEGKLCVWISTATGEKHLIDADDFQKAKDIPWHNHNGYAAFRSSNGTLFLHQLICPCPKGMRPDHENGNRWDCRKQNLRPATKPQNGWNAKLSKRNRSGVKGVRPKFGKFQARIAYMGVEYHLGLFDLFEDAVRARKKKEEELYGEFRRVA